MSDYIYLLSSFSPVTTHDWWTKLLVGARDLLSWIWTITSFHWWNILSSCLIFWSEYIPVTPLWIKVYCAQLSEKTIWAQFIGFGKAGIVRTKSFFFFSSFVCVGQGPNILQQPNAWCKFTNSNTKSKQHTKAGMWWELKQNKNMLQERKTNSKSQDNTSQETSPLHLKHLKRKCCLTMAQTCRGCSQCTGETRVGDTASWLQVSFKQQQECSEIIFEMGSYWVLDIQKTHCKLYHQSASPLWISIGVYAVFIICSLFVCFLICVVMPLFFVLSCSWFFSFSHFICLLLERAAVTSPRAFEYRRLEG